jgi:Domain of unknown function (DUF4328)
MVDRSDLTTFQPLRGPMKWAIIALVVVAVLDADGIGSNYLEYDLYDRILSGGSFTQHQLDDPDLRQGAVALLQFIALIGAAVFLLRWFHRSYKNLRAVGGEQRYGQGWSIRAWFIPILNLFRPKQIANDIWQGSDPTHPTMTLLNWWWAAFFVSEFAENVAGRLAFHGNTASDIRSADMASLVGESFDLIAAILAILVVRAITARLMARAEVVS